MIRNDIKDFLNSIPQDITLVAATKYGNVNDLKCLYESGINNFGENRVEDFLIKHNALSNLNINWHFIGHLQKNKAKKVANKIKFLHSLDNLELAILLDKYTESQLFCFIEVSINGEENKDGVEPVMVKELIRELQNLKHIKVVGLMMMSKRYSDEESLNKQFSQLRILRDNLEKELNISLPYLSMGMSEDYQAAIKNGATHLRLGRILFKGFSD